MAKRRKQGGRFTEPDLPSHVIVDESGVLIEHLYRSGDHGPPHCHVSGQGAEVCIGQNGHPLGNQPPLTAEQKRVVQDNRRSIRKAVRKIGRWYLFNNRL